ncbi:MAG: hypothetical protein AB7O59_12655 [Pirellulales bacterium]
MAFALTSLAWAAQTALQVQAPAGSVDRSNVPPKIAAFLEACETTRRGMITQLEFELRGLRSRQPQPASASQRIARIEANLAALRANQEPIVPALRFPPEIGAIGRLPELTCHVDQVLGPDEALIHCHFSIKVRTVKNYRPRLETVVRAESFLLRGLPTKALSAGADAQLLDVFEVTRRHTYRSVAGKPVTVLVLSPFDMKAIEPYFRAIATGN